jgi:hypothetical protein
VTEGQIDLLDEDMLAGCAAEWDELVEARSTASAKKAAAAVAAAPKVVPKNKKNANKVCILKKLLRALACFCELLRVVASTCVFLRA